MLSFLYVYSDHSILECYNLFSGVELSMRSFFVIPKVYSKDPFCRVPHLRKSYLLHIMDTDILGKYVTYCTLVTIR